MHGAHIQEAPGLSVLDAALADAPCRGQQVEVDEGEGCVGEHHLLGRSVYWAEYTDEPVPDHIERMRSMMRRYCRDV